ncbi:MAG: hypothetical protein HGA53_02185, partial [Anaerolineaceae bacterium]|nr:hypothetical protein [Anaerolineaceae bacterium]
RLAKLAFGTNEGFVIANGLLDIFTPGDIVVPVSADTLATFSQQPTPDIRAFLATATPQATSTLKPTVPLPTPITPAVSQTTQPSAAKNDATLNISILLGAGAAAIVLIILTVVLIRTRKK